MRDAAGRGQHRAAARAAPLCASRPVFDLSLERVHGGAALPRSHAVSTKVHIVAGLNISDNKKKFRK